MDPISPLPAIVALVMAFATSFLLVKKFGAPPLQGRFASIDGLRGYLAFFVFLHHSCIWYFYLRTGQWQVPPSNLYTHFGQTSVAFFFMITGFLFFSKLIEGKTKRIDWGKLFVSRILRLVPLYFFLMFSLFLIVAYLSNGILNEPFQKLLIKMVRWFGFTILGGPNLNGIEYTGLIIAGVAWSLPYEWFFYLSLPLLALMIGVVAPLPFIALSVVSLFYFEIWNPNIYYLSFLSGITAAFLCRSSRFRDFAVRKISSFVVLACLASVVTFYSSVYGVAPNLLLAIAFALIASGNTLFGLLISPVSRALGELAYGIYLLHGISLFIVFTFIIGWAEAKLLSSISHWLIIALISPVLIFICFFTFRFIEYPAMQSTVAVTVWLRARFGFIFNKRTADAT